MGQLLHPTSRQTIPKVRHFREMAVVAITLGGPLGLDEWVEARRRLGLITDPAVERLAGEVQTVVGRMIDAALDADLNRRQGAAPKQISWEERQRLINERESAARKSHRPVGCRTTLRTPPQKPQRFRSLAERMAAGFERNVRRDVP